jgi:hypothetical protein
MSYAVVTWKKNCGTLNVSSSERPLNFCVDPFRNVKNLCRDLNSFTANARFGREIDRLYNPKLDWLAFRLEPMPPIYDL